MRWNWKYLSMSSVLLVNLLAAQPINRKALVERHTVVNETIDSLSALTVGNGGFAFTVDITGLQTFPLAYKNGIPLGTQSDWGWHNFMNTSGYRREESLKNYALHGREISYEVQVNAPERNKKASDWFRQNPHRLQLGNLGFILMKKDGSIASIQDLKNLHQELNMWQGEIHSHFTLENEAVDVITLCDAKSDAIAVKIKSALLKQKRLQIQLVFPYPSGGWTDEGVNQSDASKHSSSIVANSAESALLLHQLDTTVYHVQFDWKGAAALSNNQAHHFVLDPKTSKDDFEFVATYTNKHDVQRMSFSQSELSSRNIWQNYWQSGAAIDFAGSKDPRAFELERRVVLSQYLMRVQEAGPFPPQETGLTYNSWFGKPHLEMTWWHKTHFALWDRKQYLEPLLNWYASVENKAKKIAARQGYTGARWQKMTDNDGEEAPSSVGAFLIWQQPHLIYFAELCYRKEQDANILHKYKDLVFSTAEFMSSFANYDSATKRYILGKGLIAAQERFKAEETFNPAYELVYWKWALGIALEWRKRLHLPLIQKWQDVMQQIAALKIQDNKYLFTESAVDSYTNPKFRTDHPSVLAAFGVMPQTGQVDTFIMKNTFQWIWKNWSWEETWGWDFPMVAMTATRLNMPDKAIDALMMPITTNTYLVNGHNYQDNRLRLYMPGNGGLLTAIAMMVGGYDGCKTVLPGIPKNGLWKIKYERLQKMP